MTIDNHRIASTTEVAGRGGVGSINADVFKTTGLRATFKQHKSVTMQIRHPFMRMTRPGSLHSHSPDPRSPSPPPFPIPSGHPPHTAPQQHAHPADKRLKQWEVLLLCHIDLHYQTKLWSSPVDLNNFAVPYGEGSVEE